jgi:hypothetical protein
MEIEVQAECNFLCWVPIKKSPGADLLPVIFVTGRCDAQLVLITKAGFRSKSNSKSATVQNPTVVKIDQQISSLRILFNLVYAHKSSLNIQNLSANEVLWMRK